KPGWLGSWHLFCTVPLAPTRISLDCNRLGRQGRCLLAFLNFSHFRKLRTRFTSKLISDLVSFLPNPGIPALPLATIDLSDFVLVMLEFFFHHSGSVKSGALKRRP